MLLKVSWRNIWRNKTRSLVVIIAIALGLWAGIFGSAFVQGMVNAKVKSLIEMEVSHFQFHHPVFREDQQVNQTIVNKEQIFNKLQGDDNVLNYTSRLKAPAMIATAGKNGAINIIGVDKEKENELTQLQSQLIEGEYFTGIRRNPILVSSKIAEEYKLGIKSKLVLTFLSGDGNIAAANFRVAGIYKTDNGMFDKVNVYVDKNDLGPLLNIGDEIHEIAVLLNSFDSAETIASRYSEEFSDSEVLPWMDLASGMRYMLEAFDVYLYIIVGIILLALLFSIVNTMFMAVLERVREIGMLMAIGMTKGRVFSMIMIETVIMSMIGCPIGLLLSYLSILYFGNQGINLSGAAYEDVGFGSIVYPALSTESYVHVAIMVFVMAIIAAIFPARKALKLKPVEAIRKI